MSRSPFDGSLPPVGRIVIVPPPLSAACTAARNVHEPPCDDTQLVAPGVASAASVVSLTVKLAALATPLAPSTPSAATATSSASRRPSPLPSPSICPLLLGVQPAGAAARAAAACVSAA